MTGADLIAVDHLQQPNWRVGWIGKDGKFQYTDWCSDIVARVSYNTLSAMFPETVYCIDERNVPTPTGDAR